MADPAADVADPAADPPAAPMSHVLRYAARTDRGLLRANNQDSVFAGDRLLVIADGMGGHAAGDVASRLVVAAFVDLDELPLGSDMVRPLTDATREGNSAIAEMVGDNPELDGMGTTLTALLFDGPVVALAHVGDSRAYLYRNGVLHQISHDDTFVQSLVDDGRITADEAAHHPQRSLLLRALNGTDMDPSITLRETSPGDRFLICSDGLSDVVSPESIADALAGADPDQVADNLIQLALVGGGPDNVTVIVADVVETGGNDGFGVRGVDPEATGPMQPIHLTQKMPRVPLPPIPEEPPAKAEYALHDGLDPVDDGYDNDLYDDDDDDDDSADDLGTHPVSGSAHGSTNRLAGDRAVGAVIGAPRPPRWYRRWAFALALAVLVGVGITGSYMWTASKYYVGDHDDQVTVFRGVNGSLLGWRLASAEENSCLAANAECTPLKVKDLVQAARDQVTAGIPVGTLADARAVVTRLTSQQLPPCPTAHPATGSTAPVASSGPSVSSRPGAVVPGPGSGASSVVAGTTPYPSSPRASTASTVPTSALSTSAPAPRTTAARPAPTPRTTAARPAPTKSSTRAPARTTPKPGAAPRSSVATTPTSPTPIPVTTTVTVTATATAPALASASAAASASSAQRLRADPPAPTTTGPITRPREAAPAVTVTVFTTVTSTPSTSAGSSTATPLVSPAAQPGVTCRLVS